MANLDHAINWILKTHGHDVILQRRTASGHGFSNTFEKHTVRHMYPNTRGLANILQDRPEGNIHNVDMIYFFLPGARPREGDRIYEQDDRFEGYVGPAGSGQTTWIVDYALPLRGRRGQITFFTVGVSREEPN